MLIKKLENEPRKNKTLDMFCRLINDLDVNVFNFKKFGKELPKQHNLSPNSFIQVALQLAYYRSVTDFSRFKTLPFCCPGTRLEMIRVCVRL